MISLLAIRIVGIRTRQHVKRNLKTCFICSSLDSIRIIIVTFSRDLNNVYFFHLHIIYNSLFVYQPEFINYIILRNGYSYIFFLSNIQEKFHSFFAKATFLILYAKINVPSSMTPAPIGKAYLNCK